MTTASTVTNLLFIGLVAAMAMVFVLATLRAFEGNTSGATWIVLLAIVLDVTIVVPGVLAYLGLVDRYDTRPPLALVPVLVATLCTVAVAFSSIGERFAQLPLSALVGYQVFRVPVEWLLHRLFLEGVVPVQMTFHGRNFDIVSGLTGGLLGLWLLRKHESPLLVTLWNCMGLALLANIVAVAMMSTPAPFRTFLEGPANRLPGVFPYVWLPTFLVQAALFGHLIVFRALSRRPGRAS